MTQLANKMGLFSARIMLFALALQFCCFTHTNAIRIHWKYANDSSIGGAPGNKIVGGVEAAEAAAPYQVSIQTKWGTHICGGVIIDKEWILTAGHCVEDYDVSNLLIITGTNEWKKPGAIYQPTSATIHCMYDVPVFYHNDIAAVRVDGPIVFNEHTQPIELADKPVRPGDVLTLTGWGDTAFLDPTPDRLRTINLTVIAQDDCRAAWDYADGIDIGHICTFTREGEGACNGDSGGPLILKNKLIGLVNWGAPCAKGKPDMHANIPFYYEFVKRAMTQCKRPKS